MEISTIEQLQLIGNDPAYPLDGDYVLTQDIDASDTVNWNDGAGFAPIGPGTAPFAGTLDGQGFGVTDLYINRPAEQNVGLVCTNIGTVTNCYTTGAVTGGLFVGGLVGFNSSGTVTNCYATGGVTGSGTVGGLIGASDGTVTNCYATGGVTGESSVGGLVGSNIGTVTNCYYDSETSGQSDDDGRGTPKTTAEMKSQTTFVGWDFDEVWDIDAEINNGYPYLLTEPVSMVVSPLDFVTGGESNSIVFNVVTTAKWEVASDSAWAVVSPRTGSGNATITVACAANTGDARDAIITVTGVYTDPEFINIAVTQMAFAEPDLKPPLPPLQPANLPTSSVASAYYDEYVTLYRQSSLNEENEPEYTPYTLLCRLDRKTHRITDGSGLQVTCSHVMLTDTEIDPVTDYIVTAALDKLIPKEVLEHKDLAASHYEVWLV